MNEIHGKGNCADFVCVCIEKEYRWQNTRSRLLHHCWESDEGMAEKGGHALLSLQRAVLHESGWLMMRQNAMSVMACISCSMVVVVDHRMTEVRLITYICGLLHMHRVISLWQLNFLFFLLSSRVLYCIVRSSDASDSSDSSSKSMAGNSDFLDNSEATRCFNVSDIDHSASDATVVLYSECDVEPLE